MKISRCLLLASLAALVFALSAGTTHLEAQEKTAAPAPKAAAGSTDFVPYGRPAPADEAPAATVAATGAATEVPGEVAAGDPAPKPAAPEPLPPEVNATITNVVGIMEGAEKTLTAIKSVDTDLGRLRDEIDGVIAKTTQTADSLRPAPRRRSEPDRQARARARKGRAAGSRPQPRPSACALKRKPIELSGAIKTLEVTWWRARQAIEKITDLRLELFVKA